MVGDSVYIIYKRKEVPEQKAKVMPELYIIKFAIISGICIKVRETKHI